MKVSLNALYQVAKGKGKTEVCRFMRDMRRAKLLKSMSYYSGRFFWHGPAVSCNNIQDVLSNTKIKCQYDQLGLGYIVYPKQSVQMDE